MRSVLDLCVVTGFVLIGRLTHEEGLASLGTLHALWPFLIVAILVLGGGFLGWRLVGILLEAPTGRRQDDRRALG